MIESYGSPIRFGARGTENITMAPFHIQEKYDGSQMSFSLTDEGLIFKSRRSEIDPSNRQFSKAIEHIRMQESKLPRLWVFRGEAITKKKHNVISYGREPDGNFVLFDVEYHDGVNDAHLLSPFLVAEWAAWLGIEAAAKLPNPDDKQGLNHDYLNGLLSRESSLGGMMEGVVVKSLGLMDRNGNPLRAKHVCSKFKEIHTGKRKSPRTQNAENQNLIKFIAADICPEARFQKAFQHLHDEGLLALDMTDMGKLLEELHGDLVKEGLDPAKEALWKHFGKQILHAAKSPLKDWWINKLQEGVN